MAPPTFWQHLAEHHGVISRRAADSMGVSKDDLARLVELGAIERVVRSTYRATAHPRTFHHRVQVALVATGLGAAPSAVGPAAARDTATRLWGIEPRGGETGLVRVVAPHDRMPGPDLPWVRVHRSRTLRHHQVVLHDGLLVTTPARTIVDCAINRSVPDLGEIVARALQARLLDLPELSAALEAAGRIRGSSRLREAVARLDPDRSRVESQAEAVAAAAFRKAGLDVVPQWPVEVGGQAFRLDFAVPPRRLAIEVDGHWWHSTPRQKARDDRRQNLLTSHGWRILRFGAGRVLRAPDAVAAEVRSALRTAWAS